MVGLFDLRPGDGLRQRERTRNRSNLRLPGVPSRLPSGATIPKIDYDIRLAFYDCCFDDGDAAPGARTTAAASRIRSGGARPSSATCRTTASSATCSPTNAPLIRSSGSSVAIRLRLLGASIARIYGSCS